MVSISPRRPPPPKKITNPVNAEGGNRTLTPLRGQDFESCASASSATSAMGVIIGDLGCDVNGQIVGMMR
jgi:hypothetical protein